MPGMNGAEVCRIIKSNPNYVGTRIVGMTGFANYAIIDEMNSAGIDKMLRKPIDMKELEIISEQFLLQPIAV